LDDAANIVQASSFSAVSDPPGCLALCPLHAVEEMLSERGVDASNETIRRWFLKFGRLGMRCAGLIAGTTAIASVLSS